MQVQKNVLLADLTSFGTGGTAEQFIIVETENALIEALSSPKQPLWFLGYGTNVLISDYGLPGTTLQMANKSVEIINEAGAPLFIAGAGASWDDVVKKSLGEKLWGLELMSGIPGGVGAAVVGNIAAYGQAVANTLEWVDVIDTSSDNLKIERLDAKKLGLKYRYSNFQNQKLERYLIIRAAFRLSRQKTSSLVYNSAKRAANELNLDVDVLPDRRKIIMEARRRAGSLLEHDQQKSKTAGSFFRNPVVDKETAMKLIEFEERGVNVKNIAQQNLIHGGSSQRVSAAHVLLAAGFKRGQSWGSVRLHPEHVLKIENTGGASSQQIYNVAIEIMQVVKEKLNITLEPEVRFLGQF